MAIQEHLETADKQADLTAERLKSEIAKVAFANVPIGPTEKMKGLDLGTKVLGMQISKQEIETTEVPYDVKAFIDEYAKERGISFKSGAIELVPALKRKQSPAALIAEVQAIAESDAVS